MTMMPGLSSEAVKILMRDTLRLFVGHGRVSWSDLAVATFDGEGAVATYERRLRSYVEDGGPQMPLDVFMRVFAVLPPEALGRVVSGMGYSVAPIETDDAATVRRGIAAAARFAASGAEALEDGVLTHVERAQLADHAITIMPIIQSIAGKASTPP